MFNSAKAKLKMGARAVLDVFRKKGLFAVAESVWRITIVSPDGTVRYRSPLVFNQVTLAGLDNVLDTYFRGSAYTAANFIGLVGASPTVNAGHTMNSHAGWTEVTAYSQSSRPAYSPAASSGQTVSNSVNPAIFTINANSTTVGGAFICTNADKGGTTGVLYGVVAFDLGDQVLNVGDTLRVECDASMAPV